MKYNILCSIHLYWAYQIFKKTKTLEIRKSKLACPATVYLYISKNSYKDLEKIPKEDRDMCKNWIGKVALKFTLNQVDTIEICDPDILINGEQCYQPHLEQSSKLKINDIMSYIGYGNDHDGWGRDWDKGYAWHIDDLKIYDKPKELDTFIIDTVALDCGYGNYNICNKVLTRPPQSWCYVEELEEV